MAQNEKLISASKIGLGFAGLMFAVFLGDHLIGIRTMPDWSGTEMARGLAIAVLFGVFTTGISYIYQAHRERHPESKD
jgi:hypothetical protein